MIYAIATMRALAVNWFNVGTRSLAPSLSILVASMYNTSSPCLLLRIFQRRHLLHNSRRHAHGDTPSRDILRHDCTRCDCAALSDGHAGQNHRVSANPAVITDYNRLRILDVIASRLYLRLVCRSHDRHVGPEHDCLANGDKAAVQDRKVEVGVEAVSRLSARLAQLFLLLALTGLLH